ncbi:MAG TPA: hypothetical protein VIR63_04900 [Pontiella sp.]
MTAGTQPAINYQEEGLKVPVVIVMVVLCLIITPLGYWIYKTDQQGSQSSNAEKYDSIVRVVEADVAYVKEVLKGDKEEMKDFLEAKNSPIVALKVPETGSNEVSNMPGNPKVLNVSMEGIYWSSDNPLVGLGGETYRVGDKVQGYEITYIGKTSVEFKAPDGSKLVKEMYESLLK